MFLLVTILLFFIPIIQIFSTIDKDNIILRIAARPKADEIQFLRKHADQWAKEYSEEHNVNVSVKIVVLPLDNEQCYIVLSQGFQNNSQTDLVVIDIVWIGAFADFLVCLGLSTDDIFAEHMAIALDANSINKAMYAVPFYIDVPLLFCRQDLLDKYGYEIPKTWHELIVTAKKIQDSENEKSANKIWGFVFQGRAYEGLICNVMEWMESYSGGLVTNSCIVVNSKESIAAMEMGVSLIGSISPPGVLGFGEMESRAMFQEMKAVFMRSWPYVWQSLNNDNSGLKNKFSVSVLPSRAGSKACSTIGGWGIGVTKSSKYQNMAISLAHYLTSIKVQKEHAIKHSFSPTIKSLYYDSEVIKANPIISIIFNALQYGKNRPISYFGRSYNQASAEAVYIFHDILSGEITAKYGLQLLFDIWTDIAAKHCIKTTKPN